MTDTTVAHREIDWSRLRNVHAPTVCAGRPCVVHNPSDHHMRSWDQVWCQRKGIVERQCPHGVGHPDPDQPGDGVHGCDGCCNPAAEGTGAAR